MGQPHLVHFGEVKTDTIGLKQPKHTDSGEINFGPIIIASSFIKISLILILREATIYRPFLAFFCI